MSISTIRADRRISPKISLRVCSEDHDRDGAGHFDPRGSRRSTRNKRQQIPMTAGSSSASAISNACRILFLDRDGVRKILQSRCILLKFAMSKVAEPDRSPRSGSRTRRSHRAVLALTITCLATSTPVMVPMTTVVFRCFAKCRESGRQSGLARAPKSRPDRGAAGIGDGSPDRSESVHWRVLQGPGGRTRGRQNPHQQSRHVGHCPRHGRPSFSSPNAFFRSGVNRSCEASFARSSAVKASST